METLQTILLVLQVLVAISLIGLILIQHGKGADAGAAFGSGASHTVFGAQGSGNFLSRTTAILAFIFLTNSLGLAYIASQRVQTSRSIMESSVIGVEPDAGQTSGVINEIPAEPEPLNTAVTEIPADPMSAAEVSEVPAMPQTDVSAEPEMDTGTINIAPVEVAPAVETDEHADHAGHTEPAAE